MSNLGWADLPNTLSGARALGTKQYFTGNPCPKGHVCPRFTSNQGCQLCLNLQSAQWLEKNQDYNKARCSSWAKNNPEKNRARSFRWYHANPDKARTSSRESYRKHPQSKKFSARKRRAKLKRAQGEHTPQDIVKLYIWQRGKCYWCKKRLPPKFHIDHMFPLALGGTDDLGNLCLACPNCNLHKSNKRPEDFAGRWF